MDGAKIGADEQEGIVRGNLHTTDMMADIYSLKGLMKSRESMDEDETIHTACDQMSSIVRPTHPHNVIRRSGQMVGEAMQRR